MRTNPIRAILTMARGSLLALAMLTAGYSAAPAGDPDVVAKFDSGGNPTANAAIIEKDGRVGIGTNTPSAKLNIDPQGPGGIVVGNADTGSGGFTSLLMDISAERDGKGSIQAIKRSGSEWGSLLLNHLGGHVGIWTEIPSHPLHVAGIIRSSKDGFMFPDGTIQSTAAVGVPGPRGPTGPAGPAGPAVKTSAVCLAPPGICSCSSPSKTVIFVRTSCTVTSDTGTCSAQSSGTTGNISLGSCCVCAP